MAARNHDKCRVFLMAPSIFCGIRLQTHFLKLPYFLVCSFLRPSSCSSALFCWASFICSTRCPLHGVTFDWPIASWMIGFWVMLGAQSFAFVVLEYCFKFSNIISMGVFYTLYVGYLFINLIYPVPNFAIIGKRKI